MGVDQAKPGATGSPSHHVGDGTGAEWTVRGMYSHEHLSSLRRSRPTSPKVGGDGLTDVGRQRESLNTPSPCRGSPAPRLASRCRPGRDAEPRRLEDRAAPSSASSRSFGGRRSCVYRTRPGAVGPLRARGLWADRQAAIRPPTGLPRTDPCPVCRSRTASRARTARPTRSASPTRGNGPGMP